MKSSASPVIVLGMHRSGTSFLSRQLEDMGVFQGRVKDSNNESIFFLRLNNWLLRQSGSSWGNPEVFLEAVQNDSFRELLLSHMKYRMHSWESAYFYGAKLRLGGYQDLRWGWKDPRMTFTLPLWLELYPDARVIAIRRHGVDVAVSLNKRALAWMHSHRNPKLIDQLKLRLGGYGDSYNSLTLQGAFDMWNRYESRVDYLSSLLKDRFYSIKYEDIPASSIVVEGVLGSLGLDLGKSQEICDAYDVSRMYTYRRDDKLLAFADDNIETLRKFGYE